MPARTSFEKKAFHFSVPKEAKLSTRALMRGGAKARNGQLVLTDKQVVRYEREMNRLGLAREKIDYWAKKFYEMMPESKTLNSGEPYSLRGYGPIMAFIRSIYKGNLKGKKICEIGFGSTEFMELLKEQGAKMFGIDESPSQQKQVKGLRAEWGYADGLNKSFKGRFDVIYSKDCITSARGYPDLNLFTAKTLHGKLNKGGFLVLSSSTAHLNFDEAMLRKAGFRILVPKTILKTKHILYDGIMILQKI
ncbi:MAG: methyltransferase domain-containing protein [Candidatus Diapherotrites archaeon]